MKKLKILIVLAIIFSSCSSKDDVATIDHEGKWQLTEMNGSIPNSKTMGSEMEWQEFYLLNADGTFKKSRERDGVITEVNGTYSLVDSSNENLLEFVYETGNNIIGTCNPDILKEVMHFQSENIFSSTWQQCDGPGLKYEKRKQ